MSPTLQKSLSWLLLMLAAGGFAAAQEVDPSSLAIPPIIYELRAIQDEDPDHTVVKTDGVDAVWAHFSGTIDKVAQYQGLDSGVYLRNLLFINSAGSGLITVEADTAGRDSRRLFASYNDPGTLKLQISDTRVPHRLEHEVRGISQDFNPGATYAKVWERINGEVQVGLSKGETPVSVFADFDSQTRSGTVQHSFFQLHRFNCTDCHSFSASQGLSQSTNTFHAGLQASLANRTSLYASLGGSKFTDNSSQLNFNFGGPFTSAVTNRWDTQDTSLHLKAYTGNENYRVGGNVYSLSRTGSSGVDFRGRYYSGNFAYQLSDQFALLLGYTGQDESNSLLSSLSTSRRSSYAELQGHPTRWLNMRVRLGQDDSNYNIGIGGLLTTPAFSNTRDRYVDARVDARPDRDLRVGVRYRGDSLNNPFFTTAPTRRDLFEAWATWSPSPVILGVNYRRLGSSNSIYSSNEESTSAYVNALVDDNVNLYGNYNHTRIDQNSMGPIVLQDALNLPLQLQVGYPYQARLNTLLLGADFAVGDLHARPYYRWVGSQSQGLFLPGSVPSLTDDSRMDLVQSAFGLHVDLPAWENTSLGLGYERQAWTDRIRSYNDGLIHYFSINCRSRF